MKYIPKTPPVGGSSRARILLLASLGSLAAPLQTFAVPVDMGAATTYTQNFDTLPSTGTTNVWANDTTLASWYAEQQTGTLSVIQASTGSLTTGALYSFGAAATAERALGSICSNGTGAFAYGVSLHNTGATTLVINSLAYTGEQWRNGGNATPQKLAFSYKKDIAQITALTAATPVPAGWTAVTAADFQGPIAAASAATLDGNLAANQAAISTNPSISVAPGEYIFLRWHDPNDASNDHGLAIDNLAVGWTIAANPSLTANATITSFSESATNPASVGTVSIPAALGADLVVSLASSDTTEATVPATVTILAGATSANFNISAVDDFLADGTQAVTISASASGYINSQFGLSVTNDTDAALALTFSANPIIENGGPGASTGTVTLAAATLVDLTVNLTSSDTTEATVPASIVIPTGQASGTFAIDAVNDTEVDGNKTSLITATATGYTNGSRTLNIDDDGDTVPPPTIPVNGIAFTGFNADGNDNLAFVALVPIAAGDTILFTDNEWSGTLGTDGVFNTGEGFLTWTAPAGGVTAGTVVLLNDLFLGTRSASLGTIVGTSGSFNLSGSGDTVYAFQGAPTSVTRVLAAISTFATDSIAGTGLTDYVLLADNTDIGAYNGSRTSETSYDPGYLTLLLAEANWITQDTASDDSIDGTSPDAPFSPTGFTLAVVGHTYGGWVAANVTPPQPAGFTDDHDSDGVRNGVEYFMGATGSSFTAMPAPVTVSGVSSVSYPRDATAMGVTYKVQTSPDLVTWTDIAPGDPNLDTSNPAIVKYTLPASTPGAPKLFTRLDVVTSP